MTRALVATLIAGLLASAGCVHVHESDARAATRGGPPPHAPAHGYRAHHEDVDLRYDTHLAAYIVIGHPDHFFLDGRFYRHLDSGWERCGDWKKGRWKPVEIALVPAPLVKHYKVKGPKLGKAKGHGRGPAKHDH